MTLFYYLTVCLSVRHVVVVCLSEYTDQTFMSSGRGITLVFSPSTITKSQGEPLIGCTEYTGVGKICNF